MPRRAEFPLIALCADGGAVRLPDAAKLTPIVKDLGSWVAFLKMMAGGPAAPMHVRDKTGRVVERMNVIERHRADRQAAT